MQVDDKDQGTDLLDRLVEQVASEPEPERVPEINPDDHDAVEEAAAAKALAEEEAKATTPKVEEKPEEKVPEAKPAAQPIMIPKARLDEVLEENRKLRDAAIYHKGLADARATPAEKQPEKPTPEQLLADIDTRRDALAAQVDEGKMLMSEFVKEDRKLRQEEEVLRDTMRKPAVREDSRSPSDLYLDTKTEELEAAHPYVAVLSEDDLAYLTRKAVASLAEDGVALPKGELAPRDALVLRTRIAELSDKFGPALTGKTLAPRQNPAAKSELSPEAKNRQQKLREAQEAPPDLTAAGRGGAPMEYTDTQIMAMTQDELDALPAATLEKIMARQG